MFVLTLNWGVLSNRVSGRQLYKIQQSEFLSESDSVDDLSWDHFSFITSSSSVIRGDC